MPDGMNSPESSQGVYGSSNKMWEQQSPNIPESVKAIRNVVDLKKEDEERDKNAEFMDAMYGQSREEDYAKRDRILNRLMSAEKPQDVAAAIEIIKDYENPFFGESIDRYTFTAYKRSALEGMRAFEKGSKDTRDLQKEGIIDGTIDSQGYLANGGSVRVPGYAIRVETDRGKPEMHRVSQMTYDVDPSTGERSNPKLVEREEPQPGRYKEKVYFGTAKERKALARAHEELHRILITSEILQNQTELFDKTRAALELAVKYFYNDQLYFSNRQTKWFFNAADISKMDVENLESLNNTELGDRRDKSMRLYYLVGMSETREKMLEHLNKTFNLEKILDYDTEGTGTIDNVLRIAAAEGFSVEELSDKDQKFVAAARFLISKDLNVHKVDGVWKYDLPTWYSREQRDPTRGGKGEKAVGEETKSGVRGYLTEFGNPYIKPSRDQLYTLMDRMNLIVGDEMAVNEAGRYFWVRGMRDKLGMEIYSFKNDGSPNLPTGEELVTNYNSMTFEDWQAFCADVEKRYQIPGEPVCSDLSKLFHTKMWRLKEMMKDRSAGPYLTYDKFDQLTESLLDLLSVKVDIGGGLKEKRSIREVWLGYKTDGQEQNEHAKDLGEMDWEQPPIPESIKKEMNGEAVRDNNEAYFWTMNYLAADDNVNKRPWQFIMKVLEHPGDMQQPSWYTDKIKFWKIIWHDNVLAWGNWRNIYKEGRQNHAERSREEQIKAAEDDLTDKKMPDLLDKSKKHWYDGLRSMQDFPMWMTQKIQYVKYSQSNLQAGSVDLIQLVEGQDSKHPGLAVKFGFMESEQIGKPPKYSTTTLK